MLFRSVGSSGGRLSDLAFPLHQAAESATLWKKTYEDCRIKKLTYSRGAAESAAASSPAHAPWLLGEGSELMIVSIESAKDSKCRVKSNTHLG